MLQISDVCYIYFFYTTRIEKTQRSIYNGGNLKQPKPTLR